jgi:hypothetical protein
VCGLVYKLMEAVLLAKNVRKRREEEDKAAHRINNHIFVVRDNLVVKLFHRIV